MRAETDTTLSGGDTSPPDARRAAEVFGVFLKLGLVSFGGPVAHLGFFRDEIVLRRGWVDDETYADLVAFSQFLPGPASSKLGFILGLLRAGPLGAAAAFAAFTAPSALLLVLFARSAASFDGPLGLGLIHGLKLAGVAVVAQAVSGMSRTLAADRARAALALASALVVLLGPPGPAFQCLALLVGAAGGLALCHDRDAVPLRPLPVRVGRPVAALSLVLFAALLAFLPLLAAATRLHAAALLDRFYRTGALVFGGGHVVLPLLQAAVVPPGWIGRDAFLAGYGAAQAVPGPLFTVAAYLGAAMRPAPDGFAGAALCLAAIFLPGLLLSVGALPFWSALRRRRAARAALRGANAAVVGLLGAALYDPVWTAAVTGSRDVAVALAGFLLLSVWRWPPWTVVLLSAGCGLALG